MTLKNLVSARDEIFDRYHTGVWQHGDDGWRVFRNGSWMQLPLPPQTTGPPFRSLRYVSADTRERLWYSLAERPNEHYCVEEGRLNVFRIPSHQQSASYQDRQGRLWTSGEGDRISLWKDGKAV